MSDRRPIETASFAAIEGEFAPGPAPMLQWISIADLVVDEAYQRPLAGAGRTNVRRIARDFCWTMFAPVVVSPIEGGKYAIVDGQHRTTAAALRGVEAVPCQVVIADARAQAAAFRAINGQVTAMNALALHRASLASGDPAAKAVSEATAAGGATILGYPKHVDDLKPGETLALGAIGRALKEHGRETLVAALACVTGNALNNRGGVLSANMIRALVEMLARHPDWRGEALAGAAGAINLERELDEAAITRRERGTPLWQVLLTRLEARFAARMGVAAKLEARLAPKPAASLTAAVSPALPPRAGGERLDIAAYLSRKGRITYRDGDGFRIDGKTVTRAEALAMVNDYRGRARQPTLALAQVW